jgi:hypothetical protein
MLSRTSEIRCHRVDQTDEGTCDMMVTGRVRWWPDRPGVAGDARIESRPATPWATVGVGGPDYAKPDWRLRPLDLGR